MRWDERDGVRWLEAELPGARAAFSTRLGGVSEPPYDSLNLAVRTEDDPDRVLENRRRLCSALGVELDDVLSGHQVHEAEVVRHQRSPDRNPFAEPGLSPRPSDGHATSTPRLIPLVYVADCLPVALAGPRGVAIVHCGWRGMAAGVVAHGADAVAAEAAAVGPAIGPCCYEVGPEVTGAFSGLGDGIADGRMLDLREVAKRLLDRAGVSDVEVSDLCTSCNPELFYSHRRDGARTGRQAGIVCLA